MFITYSDCESDYKEVEQGFPKVLLFIFLCFQPLSVIERAGFGTVNFKVKITLSGAVLLKTVCNKYRLNKQFKLFHVLKHFKIVKERSCHLFIIALWVQFKCVFYFDLKYPFLNSSWKNEQKGPIKFTFSLNQISIFIILNDSQNIN